jgi:MmeI, DNA-methyltransferase domain/MmeI, target recognition domain/MmeI, C-terminal domain/MmeI, helicase spacer domain/MmeI, N-terminal domain
MNIAEILLKLEDIADATFDRATFGLSLIEAYGPPKATLAKLKQGSLNKAARSGDLVWPKKLHLTIVQPGQAGPALDEIAAEWEGKKTRPRLLVATDGVEMVGLDTKLNEPMAVAFAKLVERYDFFLPLAGVEKYEAVVDSPADIKAAGRLAKFYDAILEANPGWTAHRRVHELNMFMTRILFCMFAQSTGIFPKDLFSKTLNDCTSIDGADTQVVLQEVFETLDIREDARAGKHEYAKRFPYVNGGLFRDRTEVPMFSRIARRILIDSAKLDWSEINPDIFGSMIQAVVKPEMRGEIGMHYTSVPNILKVLRPLFLDDIEQAVRDAGANVKKLEAVLARVRRIRVFDPACGSGNFLVIAYKELCKLEMRIFQLLKENYRQYKLPLSEMQLENFLGIEIEDFAVETAKLSLYIAQHQMNVLFKETFGFGPPDLPLRDSGRVQVGNATEMNWGRVCPPDPDFETYIVGNPPYLGMTFQSADQKQDIARLFGGLVKGYKELDYVACWFLKAADYCHASGSEAAFVSTNSICQGELVALLWPLIFGRQLEIGFAHQSFKWKNNASHNAGVICIVVSLRKRSSKPKRLFDEGHVREVKNISPYLIEGDDTIVRKRARSICGLPYMKYGNKPSDGGHLIMLPHERDDLLGKHPEAAPLVRRFYGSQEFIKGIERWCLWISDDQLEFAMSIPWIADRINAVRAFRLASPAQSTVDQASVAHRFIQIQDFGGDAIVIPKVSSERRRYLTVGLLSSDSIISDLAFGIYDASLDNLALLSSRLHLVWTAAVGGRMKTDYRYSNTLVWHTFPVPEFSDAQKAMLEEAAWAILEEREKYAGKTLAELYDPEKMPGELLSRHRELDEAIEGIYIGHTFGSDAERLEHLFKRYKLLLAREDTPLLNKRTTRRSKLNA